MNQRPLSFPAASPAGNMPAGVVPAGTLPAAAFEYPEQPNPYQPIPYQPMQQGAQQMPAQQMPAQQMSAQQMPAQQMSAQQMPAQQMPAQQMPAQRMLAQQSAAPSTSAQQVKQDLNELMRRNMLPQGFDLVAAAQDPAFVKLTLELPAYAAVRVYHAEKRAALAERQAMQTLAERLLARESLPRASRADTAAPTDRDYLFMSPEEFARVEREFRDKARRGLRVKL